MRKLLFLSLCLMLMLSVPAYASSKDMLDTVVSLHGNGLTKEELAKQVAALSQETGMTEDEILNQIHSELLVAVQSATPERPAMTLKSSSSGGGSGGTYQLHSSRKGTFFYQPASTLFVNHGHIGIYYTTTTIVEAANPSSGVRRVSINGRMVESGSRIMTARTTTTTQDSQAADWANGKVGNSYNNNFAINRSCGGSSFNCSQLVWCAFMQVANVDLDGNGGLGVYPNDIRDSSRVSTLRTY
ncbi:hypothetical protein DUZ99_03425 [Xylanibacillus composti]|uniref:Uncharacterized protein n=1 Tax=Xylanibacillus composti TaxID=1572762 RepID=A0A8J4H5Y4_9BACL|nr:hypothetical protein [Xylanibacillus composti]MDT9724051.1 hypothetical protein [Xylanibacillus composti]GIQ69444.1 hypothetical protein XYCOK13_22680 [Xylanibacillus composti]